MGEFGLSYTLWPGSRMTRTLTYYNQHAASFFEGTVNLEMTALHDRFLAMISPGGLVLDAGCGSGRDAKAFQARGYRISAFDASSELAQLASEFCGFTVDVRSFADVIETSCYDGIWACASLLHLPRAEIPEALNRLWSALKPAGCIYLSFKAGEGERVQDERHFTYIDEAGLRQWLDALPDVQSMNIWLTTDIRPDKHEQWVNAIVVRKTAPNKKLVTGGDDPFLPHLSAAMASASEIDLAVAFIRATGLRLLLPDLQVALSPNAAQTGLPARVRVLTSDYLDVTDPDALRLLMLLQAQGAQVRVYESAGSSFHLKAYLFSRTPNAQEGVQGTAFIGSSNISRQALQDGLEWNYRVDYPGDDGFLEARRRFEELFANPRSAPLTDAWIESYEARRVPPPRAVSPGTLEQDPPPEPSSVQKRALVALAETREKGFRRGLVVLATGLGKTWLSAFDANQVGARRILFVAHREEILTQAAQTFQRIRPHSRIGLYMGERRDAEVDVLCASVQTLGRRAHLERFSPQHFDYIVIDEFHHAAAPTYRRLLSHFAPHFLMGLTATPDRTDQSDILSLCDDNLVHTCNLFEGVGEGLLVPFHYFGIFDEVDYREVPWRNGRFDPEQLSNKLATLARARHALKEWLQRRQRCTLAFCVSIAHAEFMAKQFSQAGFEAAAVYAGSTLGRTDALGRLRDGRLAVIFCVDLFNEGLDLPGIDTIMMLRPTESKILFLQQLGRGLRLNDGKDKLVVLDFIGNHQGFLHKPQALFGVGASFKQMAEFARKVESNRLELPEGCYVNYDLQIIEFLKSLDSEGIQKEYEALKIGMGRRPTLGEFYRSGTSVQKMRQQYGSWFELVNVMGDLDENEQATATAHRDFLRDLEATNMTKCFKMVLLEAFQELDGWHSPPTLPELAARSWEVLNRRQRLLEDLPAPMRELSDGQGDPWRQYWHKNPVNAWVGGNRDSDASAFFEVVGNRLQGKFAVDPGQQEAFSNMVQEMVDYRLAAYEVRQTSGETARPVKLVAFRTDLPYFPNLKIACGHFKTGSAESVEHRSLGQGHGQLDPSRHFLACASGNSMNGGKNPIRNGDLLLLELLSPQNAGPITGTVMAIERQDEASGDDQYLLRVVVKKPGGGYILRANNPDYEDMPATDEMRTLARLKAVIDPLEMALGQPFLRESIPALFGEIFNPGKWNVGHVVLNEKNIHVLLVTLNKQGIAEDHRYLDHWIDERTFHWQSQNSSSPANKRGKEIIGHEKLGIAIHLFVRDSKLANGKGAPFVYYGKVQYKSHTGSNPMSVTFDLVP